MGNNSFGTPTALPRTRWASEASETFVGCIVLDGPKVHMHISGWAFQKFIRTLHRRKSHISRKNFYSVCDTFSGISISGFVSHFRLSVVDAIAWEHYRRSRCGRKPRFAVGISNIYHAFLDITACSRFGWPYSGCRMSSKSVITVLELAVVHFLRFGAGKRTRWIVFILESLGIFTPSATNARKNRSATYPDMVTSNW